MSGPSTPLLTLCLALALGAAAQAPGSFEPRVDYRVAAELLPAERLVRASGRFVYAHAGDSAVTRIPIHLWANAYATRDNAFARQKRLLGDLAFAFAPEEELGGYRDLRFRGSGLLDGTVAVAGYPEHVWLYLAAPLQPGDTVGVAFAYELRVPKVFSRMGRTGELYQLTQWYPKPARLDRDGWHVLPYLDLGEYDNDFGDYEVAVTVPANGIVAATGELVGGNGRAAREDRIARTTTEELTGIDSLRYGQAGALTYRCRATGVSDFAWFASPTFRVDRVRQALPASGGEVDAYAYYTAESHASWPDAAALIGRAAAFADSLVGPYPYPAITAVSAPLGVGGGMEYPTITVIGRVGDRRSLDGVLAHEAFHNWFQHMLASDERRHAWMDEGLTSWLEARYLRHYYPPEEIGPNSLFGQGAHFTTGSLVHAVLAGHGLQPAPDGESAERGPAGYFYGAYSQPQLLFQWLEAVLGSAEFERRLRAYFEAWHHRHPEPADLRAALGGEEVAWLFDDLLLGNRLPDYALEAAEPLGADSVRLRIRNVADVESPVGVAFAKTGGGAYDEVRWLPGFGGSRTLTLARPAGSTHVAIDPRRVSSEVARADNYRRIGGGRGRSPKLRLLGHLGDPARVDLGLLPALGYNAADGLLVGLALHTYTAAWPRTRLFAAPLYGLRSGEPAGQLGLRHSLFPGRRRPGARVRELELAAQLKSFGYATNETYGETDRYTRIRLAATWRLRSRERGSVLRSWRARLSGVRLDYVRGINATEGTFERLDEDYVVADLRCERRRVDALTPSSWAVMAQGSDDFQRLTADYRVGWRYREGASFLRARLFGGLVRLADDNRGRGALLPNGTTGFRTAQNDYAFDYYLLDRSSASSQVFTRDGSLTLPFLLTVPASRSWLASVSVTADAPFSLAGFRPQLYLDAAVYPDPLEGPGSRGTVMPVTGGLRLSAWKDVASVSFPLVNSAFVRESLPFNVAEPRYRDRIAFELRLRGYHFERLLRELARKS